MLARINCRQILTKQTRGEACLIDIQPTTEGAMCVSMFLLHLHIFRGSYMHMQWQDHASVSAYTYMSFSYMHL